MRLLLTFRPARRAIFAARRQPQARLTPGRVAAAGDNATMESFNSLLQKNVLDRQQWKTRDALR